MRMLLRTLKAAVLLLVVGTAASCAGYGGLGDVLAGDVFARDLTGEVRHVDVRRQTIELRTRDGRSTRVDYDRRTQVEYAGRRYPVSALERGDYVSVLRLRRGDHVRVEVVELSRNRLELRRFR
jgi:hypothetical protein